VIYAENEILGNIKCLLMPGCLLLISLLMPGSTVQVVVELQLGFHLNCILVGSISNIEISPLNFQKHDWNRCTVEGYP